MSWTSSQRKEFGLISLLEETLDAAVKLIGRNVTGVRGDAAKLLLESADGEDLRSIRDLAKMAVLLGCGRS